MAVALPIDSQLPRIVAAVRAHRRLVLQAEPGAGKTTRVPPALLDAGLAGERAVVVLEPRRIAARAAAVRVAGERGEPLGARVGYRVRFEQRGRHTTRLWYVTDGVFGRRLGEDPFLDEVGVVVLDEFHERHLEADVALAVVCALQESVRSDLRLVVMSATLDAARLAAALPDAVHLSVPGRPHPVAVHWMPPPARSPLGDSVRRAVETLLAGEDDGGDILVFLPGAAEIRRTAMALAGLAQRRGFALLALHGDLPLDAQERVLQRGAQRRLILSTNVAETALTLEGVTAVVDSGLVRTSRFDPQRDLERLVVVPISRASAEQRAGRAGRTAPGRCIRLWSRDEHAARRAHDIPEILRRDLARVVLELRAWGMGSPGALPWLEAPPAPALVRAERLLAALGGLGPDGAITETGRRMLALPAAPRLARVLIEAEREGCGRSAAVLAALASERDVLLGARTITPSSVRRQAELVLPAGPSDLLVRLELLEDAGRRGADDSACRALGLEPQAVRGVRRLARRFERVLAPGGNDDPERLLRCLLAGFVDRVARRRAPGSDRALMVGGLGLRLAPTSVVREAELFVAVVVEAGDRGGDALVRLASLVRREWLEERFPWAFARERSPVFDETRAAVVEREQERFFDLVLAERFRADVDRATAGRLLATTATTTPTIFARIAREQDPLLARIRFLGRARPELGLPDEPSDLLADAIHEAAVGCRALSELAAPLIEAAVLRQLTAAQRHALARDAPLRYRLPSGREVPVRYERDRPPVVSARVQELFGLTTIPRLGGGRVPILLEVLAPNARPVQVTSDLESFWGATYPELRRLLRGRYPRHAWPEDPRAPTPPDCRSGRRTTSRS